MKIFSDWLIGVLSPSLSARVVTAFLCLKFEKQIDNGRGNVECRMKNEECRIKNVFYYHPDGFSPLGGVGGGLGTD